MAAPARMSSRAAAACAVRWLSIVPIWATAKITLATIRRGKATAVLFSASLAISLAWGASLARIKASICCKSSFSSDIYGMVAKSLR